MRAIFRAIPIISLVALSMLVAVPSAAEWDAGWRLSEDRAVLAVRNGGDIGIEDGCPEYRWLHSYSDIRAALHCAHAGDKIRLRPGELFSGGLDEPLGTIIVDKDITFIGRHRIDDAMSIVLARFEIYADVRFSGLMIMKDSRSAPAFRGGLIETVSAGSHVDISHSHLVGGGANEGGAVMVNEGTEVVIRNSSVLAGNNATTGAGGAVYNNGTLTIVQSQVFHNNAVYGGGIYNAGQLFVVSGVITGNNAQTTGGGIFSENENIFIWNDSAVVGNQPDDCVGCN